MKKLLPLSNTNIILALSLSLVLTSCNILEEIFLNEDGSGVYRYTFDGSKVFELDGVLDEYKERDTDSLKTPLERRDSTYYLKDWPDSVKNIFSNNKLLDRVVLHSLVDEQREKLVLTVEFKFHHVSEINELMEQIAAINSDPKLKRYQDPFGGFIDMGSTYRYKENTLLCESRLNKDHFKGLDEMTMVAIAASDYKRLIHMPGKVKETSIRNSRVLNRKSVVSEWKMIELMKVNKALEGGIVQK